MTPPEFSIIVDSDKDFVHITMSGFFGQSDIDRLVIERDRAYRSLTCAKNHHVLLNDIRGMEIQTQDAVRGFQAILSDPDVRARRMAYVISRSLARMQAKRISVSRDARYFETPDEAKRWLLSESGEDFGSQAA